MKTKGKIYRFFLAGVLLAMAMSTISCGGRDSSSRKDPDSGPRRPGPFSW